MTQLGSEWKLSDQNEQVPAARWDLETCSPPPTPHPPAFRKAWLVQGRFWPYNLVVPPGDLSTVVMCQRYWREQSRRERGSSDGWVQPLTSCLGPTKPMNSSHLQLCRLQHVPGACFHPAQHGSTSLFWLLLLFPHCSSSNTLQTKKTHPTLKKKGKQKGPAWSFPHSSPSPGSAFGKQRLSPPGHS